ncbi:hypothetical protein, partial [Streptomyces sp. NPDC003395]
MRELLRWAVRVFYLGALLVDSLLFIGLSVYDVFLYSDDEMQFFSVLLRFAIGVLNGFALFAAIQLSIPPRGWWREHRPFPSADEGDRANLDWKWPTIMAAQMAALPFLFFPILIEKRSPVHENSDLAIAASSGLLLILAFCIIFHIARHHGEPKAAWGVVAAFIPLVGTIQFWYQNFYQPTHDRPRIDIAASVERVGNSGSVEHLRGTITLHNAGSAGADVLGSMYKAVGYRVLDNVPQGPGSTLGAIMDSTNPNFHHFMTGENFLTADDVLQIGDTLTPGQQWKTSFVFDADTRQQDLVLVTSGGPWGSRAVFRAPCANSASYDHRVRLLEGR